MQSDKNIYDMHTENCWLQPSFFFIKNRQHMVTMCVTSDALCIIGDALMMHSPSPPIIAYFLHFIGRFVFTAFIGGFSFLSILTFTIRTVRQHAVRPNVGSPLPKVVRTRESWSWFLRRFRSQLTRSLSKVKSELGPT